MKNWPDRRVLQAQHVACHMMHDADDQGLCQISILGGWNLVTIKIGSKIFRPPRLTSTGSLLTNYLTQKVGSSSLSRRVELELC